MQDGNECCNDAERVIVAAKMDLGYLTDGRVFSVRVTPKASRNSVELDPNGIFDLKIKVTVVPEAGKANRAVIKLLAGALNIPRSRLVLVRGETARDKQFRVV